MSGTENQQSMALEPVRRAEPTVLERIGLTVEQLHALDVEKMERLLDFQLRVDAEQARREFHAAVARVQARMTPVAREGYNRDNQSRWARVEHLCMMLDPLLVEEGFAWSFSDTDSPHEKHVRVTLTLRLGSHVEQYHYDMPIWDGRGVKGGGVMTGPQASGAMHTYACRYLRLGVFGIVQVAKDDMDGQATGSVQTITADQAADLRSAIEAAGANEAAVCAVYGVERLEELTGANLRGAHRSLEQRRRMQR